MLVQPAAPERPKESNIGQGLWEAPEALILALGAASVVIAAVIVFFVVRSRMRAKRGDDLGPISSRSGRSGPPSSRPAPRTRL